MSKRSKPKRPSLTATDSVLVDPRYLEAAATLLCERSLFEFVTEAWKVVEPGTEFIPSWHVRAICQHLEACTRGEIPRLLINIPPRCMKSLLVSVFWPAWVWIARPETRWLFASYGHNLSIRDSRRCRDVIQSAWYQKNWGRRYRLREDQNQKIRFDNDHSGFRLSTSIEGVGTGEGGDFIVADDPHNVSEAHSEAKREAVINWWDQSMSTRGNNPQRACRVVVMQRLHEEDLAGHILDQGGYEHLCLPMEFEPKRRCVTSLGWQDPRVKDGQLLCPGRFNYRHLAEMKLRLGSYGAAGQLQQRPAPLDGGLFKRDWFRFIPCAPQGQHPRVRYWDLAAAAEGDFTVGLLMSRRSVDGTFFVEDIQRGRWGPAQRDQVIEQTARQDGQGVQIVLEQEPGSAGLSVVHYLIRKLAGYRVSADRPTGSKIVRAQPFAAQCEAQCVCLVNGPYLLAYLDELCMFPNGQHDDQVDASSGAFLRLCGRSRDFEPPQRMYVEPPSPLRFGVQLYGGYGQWRDNLPAHLRRR